MLCAEKMKLACADTSGAKAAGAAARAASSAATPRALTWQCSRLKTTRECALRSVSASASAPAARCQYLNFCTMKASKLSTCVAHPIPRQVERSERVVDEEPVGEAARACVCYAVAGEV